MNSYDEAAWTEALEALEDFSGRTAAEWTRRDVHVPGESNVMARCVGFTMLHGRLCAVLDYGRGPLRCIHFSKMALA